MRRLVPVIFALLLSGCAGLNTLATITSGSTANPLTPKAAVQLHATFYAVVVVPSASYNKLPRCTISAPPCSKQNVVNKLRVYVNATERTLRKLDQWALGNTALDGPALYQAATVAIAAAKDFIAANGVQ